MKFIICLLAIALITLAVYFSLKIKRQALIISAIVAVLLLSFLGFMMFRSATAPDTQCTTSHVPTTPAPATLKTAMDYFLQGDYDYESGNCFKAVTDYTNSIRLNPGNPQAYNNRAYTNMRLRNYKDALSDLDKAIELRPDYVNALENRADIYNFYYDINRPAAIRDYQKVISLGAGKGSSVCGHLFLARHNGWNLGTILDFPWGALKSCY